MKKRIPVSGHGIIQRDVMRMDMSIYSKCVYCLLMSYKGEKNACFPSLKTISDDLRVSKNTVLKSISELEDNDLLIVQRTKKNNGENSVNLYIPDLIYEDIEVVRGGSPHEPPSSPHEPPLVHHVNTKNNIYKNNIEEFLISNEESIDSSENSDNTLFGETPKPKSKKGKKEKVPAHPAYTPIVKFFCEEYWPDYKFFGARDGKQVKEIISQIERMLSRHGEDYSAERVVEFFSAVVTNAPQFYQKKSLPIINSKFSEIVEEIKKERNGQKTSKNSNPYLQASAW